MRIFKSDNEKLVSAALKGEELFFVELWYSMTHQKSLDSYRVKCLNTRTLLRELAEELKIGLIKPADLKGLCLEITESLTGDTIINHYHSEILARILPYLSSPPPAEEKKDPVKVKDFNFMVFDFSQKLERDYFEMMLIALPDAIKSNNRKDMKSIVSNLLSDLIDRGWLIETLFQWHNHLLSKKNLDKYGFMKNVTFMLRCFKNKFGEYEVTLRLEGSDKLANVNNYGQFNFNKIPANVSPTAPKKFIKSNEFTCFAQTIINGADFLSAAINAKESFEQFADIFRFDFEPSALKVDLCCHVRRLSDNKVEYPVVKAVIPNPNEDMDHTDFLAFIDDLKTVSEKKVIDESAKRKIRGALRQYRFGRDNDNFKDKFLNWWMGLESLCYTTSNESIGETVTKNVSHIMILSYLHRLTIDAVATLKYSNIDWPDELRSTCSGKDLIDISVDDLLSLVKLNKAKLLASCDKSPVMQFRCTELFQILDNPGDTADKLELHMTHLKWHLSRLYRIRCCIVHGSDVRFRLGLLAANLEFYLKETTAYILNVFKDNDHIPKLDEIFSRSQLSYSRMIADLRSNGANHETIKRTVNSSIVIG